MNRKNIQSGTAWEKNFGYSRAVKIDRTIYISGTTSVDENNNIVGIGDAYMQAKFIIKKIESALNSAGSSLKDVVRTRIFVTDINLVDDIGRAHKEFFSEIKPASTLVEVSSLIDDNLLVEIEADAVIK